MQKRRKARERRIARSSAMQDIEAYERIEAAIHRSDGCGMLAEVAELCAAFGDGVNMQDVETGDTLLHRAARKNKALACAVLLLCGADMQVRDDSGRTACHVAAASGCIESLAVLCLVHATLTQPGARYVGALRDAGDMTPLEAAVWNQRSVAAVALCQLLGAEACELHTPDKGGRTPLGMAIAEKDWNMAGTLLWACKAKTCGLRREHTLALRLHCKVLQRAQADVMQSCDVFAEQVATLCTQYACWAQSTAAAAVARAATGQALTGESSSASNSLPRPLPCGVTILEAVRVLGAGGMQGASGVVDRAQGSLSDVAFAAADVYARVHHRPHCRALHARSSSHEDGDEAEAPVISEQGLDPSQPGTRQDKESAVETSATSASTGSRRPFPLLLTDEMWQGLVHGTGVYAHAALMQQGKGVQARLADSDPAVHAGSATDDRPVGAIETGFDLDKLAAEIEGQATEGRIAATGSSKEKPAGARKAKKSHRGRERLAKNKYAACCADSSVKIEESCTVAPVLRPDRTRTGDAEAVTHNSASDPADEEGWNEVAKPTRKKVDVIVPCSITSKPPVPAGRPVGEVLPVSANASEEQPRSSAMQQCSLGRQQQLQLNKSRQRSTPTHVPWKVCRPVPGPQSSLCVCPEDMQGACCPQEPTPCEATTDKPCSSCSDTPHPSNAGLQNFSSGVHMPLSIVQITGLHVADQACDTCVTEVDESARMPVTVDPIASHRDMSDVIWSHSAPASLGLGLGTLDKEEDERALYAAMQLLSKLGLSCTVACMKEELALRGMPAKLPAAVVEPVRGHAADCCIPREDVMDSGTWQACAHDEVCNAATVYSVLGLLDQDL